MIFRQFLNKQTLKTVKNCSKTTSTINSNLKVFFSAENDIEYELEAPKTEWQDYGILPELARHRIIFEDTDFQSSVIPKLDYLTELGMGESQLRNTYMNNPNFLAEENAESSIERVSQVWEYFSEEWNASEEDIITIVENYPEVLNMNVVDIKKAISKFSKKTGIS